MTDAAPVPAAAVTAAADVLVATVDPARAEWLARRMLEAALPHLAYAAGQAAGDHIASLQARAGELHALAAEILDSYHQASDGYRGRVGQVQIARWQHRLGETP